MTGLLDLPAELIYSIHLFSLSPDLPSVNRHLHSILTHSSPTHKATYLHLRHPRSLAHAIRYPICDLQVVNAFERLASNSKKKKKQKQKDKDKDNKDSQEQDDTTPDLIKLKLRCSELPKRLVRGLGTTNTTKGGGVGGPTHIPLLKYMLETYSSSPNSHKGYFLARAVLAKDMSLIRLLLRHGADPALKDGWAVNAAVGTGDLALVKLLMERGIDREDSLEESGIDKPDEFKRQNDADGPDARKKRRRSSLEKAQGGGGKRRKMESESRCEPTHTMLEAAVRGQHWHIVDYLTSRGALPSMDVLNMLITWTPL
ncbi:hypothetical protein T439DRAFT_329781 [Meredithblackwellia eburnea MCA 4105]